MQFSTLEKLAKNAIFPDFGELKLEQIIDLRKDRALLDFRNKIADLSFKLKSGDYDDIDGIFANDFLKQIWEIVPSKKGIAFNAFLGLISNSPVPAIGQLTSIYDFGKQVKNYRKYSSN